ncbi:MAG: HAMP domain-containing sensor histidine kinase, partial [Verrucomicrobiota bacterium]
LKHISQERYQGALLKKKATEAQEELLSMHRTSNSIGVIIDKNYQITNFEEIDLSSISLSAKSKLESEAAEKHVKLRINTPTSVKTIGDRQAIEIAIQHLLLNAIKYSHGSGKVVASLSYENDSVVFSIQNTSNIGIPNEIDHHYLWDFGYRSEQAKEAHVNGSGIGLYTVKKIVTCHYGKVSYDVLDPDKKLIEFKMILPNKDSIKAYLRMFGSELYKGQA